MLRSYREIIQESKIFILKAHRYFTCFCIPEHDMIRESGGREQEGIKCFAPTIPSVSGDGIINSNTKGPGEKGAPRNQQEIFVPESGRFRVQISLWLLRKEQSTILALFGRRILGQYPAAPCSLGPFGLLLNRTFLWKVWWSFGGYF